jgi:hypothetical protein
MSVAGGETVGLMLPNQRRGSLMSLSQTYGVLLWAVYALSRHQDMQRKLQAEIACVTTNSSLPLVRDIQQMPYLTAFVRETMRWRPVVPLGELPFYHWPFHPDQIGLPHCLFDNDVFQGDCLLLVPVLCYV